MRVHLQKNEIKKREKGLALSQIIILIVGIVAISYAFGSGLKEVSAGDPPVDDEAYDWLFGQAVENSAPAITTKPTVSVPPLIGEFDDPLELESSDITSITSPKTIKPGFWSTAGKTAWIIVKNYGYAELAGQVTNFALSWIKDEELKDSISGGVKWGIFAGKTIYDLFKPTGLLKNALGKVGDFLGTKLGGLAVGAPVALLYFALSYSKTEQEIVTFTCNVWDAPTGGDYCEECNNQGILPCSEYQCRSLGQSCELINKGTTEELCVFSSRTDREYPIISPLDAALPEGYSYKPDNAVSPPNRGVIVWKDGTSDGCAPPFTDLTFGISVNEPGRCRIDKTRSPTFDGMRIDLSSGLKRYNHTIDMNMPNTEALEEAGIETENGGEYQVYVKCADERENYNPADFVFKFCIDDGPDTQAPIISGTSIFDNMPIGHGQTSFDLTLQVNEPAECRWSHIDQPYKDMPTGVNCGGNLHEVNAQMIYLCDTTTLTELKDDIENKFYFKCNDTSGNFNKQSTEFTLIGTQPLVIDEVGPNGTIKDSTLDVKVTLTAETSAGYKEGESTCQYSETGEEGTYVDFLNTRSHIHSQDLYLAEGSYKYYIKCTDLGGNYDIEEAEFYAESDTEEPMIVRAYKDGSDLRIMTDEKARCVYSDFSCNYLILDGQEMIVQNDVEHYVDWNTNINFYIKCVDEYGNQPVGDECSMIVRPFDIYSSE